MNHLVLAELLQKAGVASASQNSEVLGSLGNVSTNVSEVAFRVLNLHATMSDVDARMAQVVTGLSDVAFHVREVQLKNLFVEHVASSGASCRTLLNPPVGVSAISATPGANKQLRLHSAHFAGAMLHAAPSKRIVFQDTTGVELFACHVGASNAANAGIFDFHWNFNNTPLSIITNRGLDFNAAAGYTAQALVTLVLAAGDITDTEP